MNDAISPALIKLMTAELLGRSVSDERAAELAAEFRRTVGAARVEASRNDFNDEPSRFAVMLAKLATPRRK